VGWRSACDFLRVGWPALGVRVRFEDGARCKRCNGEVVRSHADAFDGTTDCKANCMVADSAGQRGLFAVFRICLFGRCIAWISIGHRDWQATGDAELQKKKTINFKF